MAGLCWAWGCGVLGLAEGAGLRSAGLGARMGWFLVWAAGWAGLDFSGCWGLGCGLEWVLGCVRSWS